MACDDDDRTGPAADGYEHHDVYSATAGNEDRYDEDRHDVDGSTTAAASSSAERLTNLRSRGAVADVVRRHRRIDAAPHGVHDISVAHRLPEHRRHAVAYVRERRLG